MNDSIYQSIQNNARFKELVAKRERFAWILSAIMLGLYVAFILLIAYGPHLLGAKLSATSTVTWGMPIGVGLIVTAFILTGVYVRRANSEFDELNNAVLKEIQQ
ncbi:DUF485 domain-containing protein [Pseudomonas sp. DTU_2021_1001937_2_SI_NGA_ILE_001]|uniref:DUF485 domain-containing protein n=1 Tax=Pseudomonas sp. DTU_2021_1001937_2_SI_NGA_ILE_001 TaxID=3077589 RepID=UPI0025D79DD5|nr:DUF485 domain-containing protein [Pseudomonas sp. DTU_2021_1001937_2_SI_NGA_ILE_001]WNW14057.1 DUF485 domain-containing protein [Pseudomonas sp. DTU_2021_1001937_2_SI_NGA_ILE_001]